MSWKVRHEGSPVSVDGLALGQVAEGLQDGRWEPTDEVMGPGDADWVAIENHPDLADLAADLEPPPPRTYDDETRLDMNALIDVTLVLLIFFILTTSYAAIQKILEAANVTIDAETGVLSVTKEQVKQLMVHVVVAMEGDRPVIRVEGQQVGLDELLPVLRGYTRGAQRKTDLLLECDPEVPRDVVIAIQDKAKGADLHKLYRLVPRKGDKAAARDRSAGPGVAPPAAAVIMGEWRAAPPSTAKS